VVNVVHGEATAADTLRRRIQHELGWKALVPGFGQTVRVRAARERPPSQDEPKQIGWPGT
jgi:metallo-beta-lactamase family protein